ncbi:hypothetical protein ACWIGI_28770 [Nocardia sp. NPDC055321]
MDEASQYQMRQWSAVIFGYRRGRAETAQKYARVVDRLLRSRRTWQSRTLEADARMERLVGDVELIRARNGQLTALTNTLWTSRQNWQSKALTAGKATKEASAQPDRVTRINRDRNKFLWQVLWPSRRHWQARALNAEHRLQLAEALCGFAQLRGNAVDALVRTDWVTFALDPNLFTKPEGWDEVFPVLERSMKQDGTEGLSV